MSLGKAQLNRLAEILRVDELVELGTLSLGYGFGIRVGGLATRVVIDEPILSTRDPAVALDSLVRALFAAAQELRARAEQAARRDALRAFIDSAKVVAPAPIEFTPLSMPVSTIFDLDNMEQGFAKYVAQASQTTYSALGLSRDQLGIPDDNPKPLNRFAAVAQELENL